VKDRNPIKRARRQELRLKYLGSDNPSCFYCGEHDPACLELEHPVGKKVDPKLTRIVCRNCHRKLEFERDVAGLTKNGIHITPETEREGFCNYLLRLAADHEATAESLRRKAEELKRTA
jgi:hypothetical protein